VDGCGLQVIDATRSITEQQRGVRALMGPRVNVEEVEMAAVGDEA
jgi:hypothetical protein